MTCPKCNKEVNLNWMCCPFHEELVMLKEKCPECGEMEKIGRSVCERRAGEVKRNLVEYQEKGGIFIRGIGLLIALVVIFLAFYLNMNWYLFVSGFIIWVISLEWDERRKKRKERKYLNLYLKDAEILEKAKFLPAVQDFGRRGADAKSYGGQRENK